MSVAGEQLNLHEWQEVQIFLVTFNVSEFWDSSGVFVRENTALKSECRLKKRKKEIRKKKNEDMKGKWPIN